MHILTLLIMAYLTNERDSKGVHDHSPSPKLAMKVGLWETGPALLQTPLGHFLGILLNLGMARNILEKKKIDQPKIESASKRSVTGCGSNT